MRRLELILAVVTAGLLAPALASAQAGGWMAGMANVPARHPGPWMKIHDDAEQARLRKELAGAGRIAFATNRDGNWEIYSCNPDGSDQKNLSKSPGWDYYPRWTPDGKILFFSDRDGSDKMTGIMDQFMERPTLSSWGWQDGPWNSQPRQVLEKNERAMGSCAIYQMDADGSNVKLLVKGAQYANLSPDGKLLVFERRGRSIARDLATGQEFDAVRRYYGGSWHPEYSPDGSRILVASMGDIRGKIGALEPPPLALLATIFDLRPDGHATGRMWNLAVGGMNLHPRWRPDGMGVAIVQGARELWIQEIDLNAPPDDKGWMVGKTIGLAKPADRYMHAYPAYCPSGKYLAFSLSPIHYLIREKVAPLGYKPWKDGYQIIWQELCVGRAVPGADNVWIQLTDGGYGNVDADWYVPNRPRPARLGPNAPGTAAWAAAEFAKRQADKPKPAEADTDDAPPTTQPAGDRPAGGRPRNPRAGGRRN